MITDESLKQQSRSKTKTENLSTDDSLAEVLLNIIKFTQTRQKILVRNIRESERTGFVPKDLPCEEFAKVMDIALEEYIRSNRLLLADTVNIKFLGEQRFDVQAIADERAGRLLETDKEEYMQLQIQKLFENALSQRFAAQLLKERQQSSFI